MIVDLSALIIDFLGLKEAFGVCEQTVSHHDAARMSR
jgi:hypothetical protein